MKITPLTVDLTPAWARLFEACHCPCYCRYWTFEGDKNAWLARCAEEPWKNRDEQIAQWSAGDPAALGLVAVDDAGEVQGWLSLAARSARPKLRRLPVYRSLDLGADAGVLSIGCLLVRPEHRRHGLAASLVAEALAFAAQSGATAVEAYPHRTSEPQHDEQAWRGTERMYLRLGFVAVAGDGPYPVLRWTNAVKSGSGSAAST